MPSPTSSNPSILIIGAGPTGLTLACELARRGVDFRIIDKNSGPSAHSKALGVLPRTLELFERLDIADKMLQRGRRLHALNAYAGGKRFAHLDLQGLKTPYPFVLSLPQSETEQLLVERLHALGVAVEWQLEFTQIELNDPVKRNDPGAAVTLRSADGAEETVAAQWVVACDGAHSRVREALPFSFGGFRYGETFSLADVTLEWSAAPDEVHAFLSDGGPLAVIPLPEANAYRLVVGESRSEEPDSDADGQSPQAELASAPTVADFERWLDQRIPQAHGFEVKLGECRWLSRFRISRRLASPYRLGGVLLAGDAAHIHSPVGGQGMNSGIQDAMNLGWKLALVATGVSPQGLLESYEAERRPAAEAILRGTDRATKLVTLRFAPFRHARDLLASFVLRLEGVRRKLTLALSQLNVDYAGSPIVGEDRLAYACEETDDEETDQALSHRAWLEFEHGPRPGAQAPDAALGEANPPGRRHLRQLLHGPESVLLLFPGKAPGEQIERKLASIYQQVEDSFAEQVMTYILAPGKVCGEAFSQIPTAVCDEQGAALQAYGASAECLYLIRPDGHIGYCCQPADAEKLLRYLRTLFCASG